MKKGIKKYVGGVPELMTPKMASVKTADVPLISGTPEYVKTGPSKLEMAGNKFSGFMDNYGSTISNVAGALVPLLIKKNKANQRPYKDGTKLIKYQMGTPNLTPQGTQKAMTDTAQNVGQNISSDLNAAKNVGQGLMSGNFNQVKDAGQNFLNRQTTGLSNLGNKVGDVAQNFMGAQKNVAGKVGGFVQSQMKQPGGALNLMFPGASLVGKAMGGALKGGKLFKKGTNMIKYQSGTKSLTKEEGKVAKGSEYFKLAKGLTAEERAAFRKLDAEAKQKGMTFEFKGLKYDPTNPVNLQPVRLSAPSTSNVGITYSPSSTQRTTSEPSQTSIQQTTTTTSQPSIIRKGGKLVGKVDAKTGYSIYPNNRVFDPKTNNKGTLDNKGNITWDTGKKEAIPTSTTTAALKDTTAKPLIKTKTETPKQGETTSEDRALNADLISLGLDFGSILSPEPISAGGLAVGSQIAVNRARRLRGESVGLGTHLFETAGTALSAVPLVGDYAKAGSAMRTIGRILKSPATRKALTAAGAAGVGLGGEQAINSMNEVYQKYEKEGLTSLGKDDLRKAMEAARLIMNATQVGKGVSGTVRKSVTLPTAQELMVPEKGIKFGITNKGNATKQVVGGAKVDKQGELEYDMTKQGKRPADMTQVEMDLRKSRREQTRERDKAAAPKKKEEFQKEFKKKTGYNTREEMRQAQEAQIAKAREQKRFDYKSEKKGIEEKYEASRIKFQKANEATKEAVKKSFKNKQAAKRNQEQNTPQEAVVMRKMGDVTPTPIKMTPSQRLLPEGPEQITSKESQEIINRINQRIRTSSNKTKAELAAENEKLRIEREARQAPIVYKSDLPSDEVRGLLPEPADLKAAREAAEEARLIKYAEEQAKADIAAEMKNPKTVKLSGKFWRNPKAKRKNR